MWGTSFLGQALKSPGNCSKKDQIFIYKSTEHGSRKLFRARSFDSFGEMIRFRELIERFRALCTSPAKPSDEPCHRSCHADKTFITKQTKTIIQTCLWKPLYFVKTLRSTWTFLYYPVMLAAG
jgi:hypothetical protein